jgi:RNA polymerase sigma-70 factor (ECF subfamily)
VSDDLGADDLFLCQRGDLRALEALFATYGDRVYRLCLHLLGQAADAEDAAQEVFLRVLQRAGQFAGRSRLSTWIYRVTVNHCLNRARRGRACSTSLAELEDEAQPLSLAPSPFERSVQAEEQAQLRGWLERLSPERRAVLVLREIEGLSYQGIAEVLDLPIGTVMSRLARARENLMSEVAKDRERNEIVRRDVS